MKVVNLSKVLGASVLGLSLAVLPGHMPVSAQTSGGGSTNTGGDTTTAAPGNAGAGTGTTGTAGTGTGSGYTNNGGGNGGYWGLFGLVGLLGLAGFNRGKNQPTAYRDPGDVTSGSGSTRY
jgi:hypothetical protein